MANSEDQLLVELARRNWIILATFVVVSLVVAGPEFTLGVAGGGLTAVCGYQWLYQSLRKALAAQGTPAVKGFQVSYALRLGALAVMLVLLVAVVKVNPLGLIIGLSVVVLNILWATFRRVIK